MKVFSIPILLSIEFKSGFKFVVKTTPYPFFNEEDDSDHDSTEHLILTQNNWMIIPHSQRNIAHFFVVLDPVCRVARQPNQYPPVFIIFSFHPQLDS